MKSHDHLTRRGLLTGAIAGGVWVAAPRSVFALNAVGGAGPEWRAALGWTLVPLETPEQFAAWDDVWSKLRDGETWLRRFRRPLEDKADQLKLEDAEGSVAALLSSRHEKGMTSFLNRAYFRVSENRTLMRIVFPDGAFRVGQAAPAIMSKWGYTGDGT